MSGSVDGIALTELASAGLIAHPTVIAEVVERFGVPGTSDPARVLLSRVAGGFEHEVLASRGLDIGHASWRGIPLSWTSPVRDARALDRPTGAAWLSRFTGGLLTTCGPFHIGDPTDDHGQHGDFSHRPATAVVAAARDGETSISGTVEVHDLFGASLTVERDVRSSAHGDSARISITDRVINTGPVPATVAMLYHVNLGPPVAVPGSTVVVDAVDWAEQSKVPEVPRPSPLPDASSRVAQAVFAYSGIRTDPRGWAHAAVHRPGSAIEFDVAWRTDGLPHLLQWVYPTVQRWALALEPATAPLFGPDRERPGHGAPRLEPGATRRHEIIVTVRERT